MDEEVPHEVFELVTLSLFGGVLEMVEQLAETGLLDERRLGRIYARMNEPFDNDNLSSDPSLALMREALDSSFASASIASRENAHRKE